VSGTLDTLGAEDWLPFYQEAFTYDANDNLASSVIRAYDEEDQEFEDYQETEYSWRQTTGLADQKESVSTFRVDPAYPNPFNPEVIIPIELSQASQVRIVVFDVLGRPVQMISDGRRGAGTHAIRLNAQGLPSGIYLIRVQVGPQEKVQRVTLLK
jgi:hypothetical protein